MKRIPYALLTLCLIVLLLPAILMPAFAAEEYTSGYYTYEVTNGEATITDVDTSISGDITIPSTLGGYPVTSIGSYAFYVCGSLTSVTIPDGVTNIGDSAFNMCENLNNVTIPDSVVNIGYRAFRDCYSLTTVFFGGGIKSIGDAAFMECGIVSLVIPESVTSIGASAFYACGSLTNITIPDSVQSIGNSAFQYCSSLTSVTIGNGVNNIGDSTFASCENLNNVTIPDSVVNIGYGAFRDCYSLTTVSFGGGIKSIGDAAFMECGIVSLVIPESVTSIGASAFYACGSLKRVTIPDSVTGIGEDAFCYCNNLTSVYISDITQWCNIAFGDKVANPLYYAENLYLNGTLVDNLVLPENTMQIGNYAFYNYDNLISIDIPSSVTVIGSYAFESCDGLLEVTIPDSVTEIGVNSFKNCDSMTKASLGDGVTSIGASAFENCDSLTKVSMGEGFESISNGAFYNCDSLSDVTIGTNVTSIGESAFYSCNNLTDIIIPNGVTNIGYTAFYNCPLYSVTIGDAITLIDSNAFTNCEKLIISEGSQRVTLEMVICKSKLKEVVIPEGVTEIEPYAFYQCYNLAQITIPGSMENIGESAFEECSSLTDVYYRATQEQWNAIKIGLYNDELLAAMLTFVEIPAHECGECGEWIVSKRPTFTSDGERYLVCSECGKTLTEAIAMLVGKVEKWNIALEDDFAVKFYLQISDSIQSTAEVRMIIGNAVVIQKISDLEKTEDGYYLLKANISAAQMNELIVVIVMEGREIGNNTTYTARKYCETILSDNNFSQYHSLIKAILHYGAMAQKYFGYDIENLANADINCSQMDVPEVAQTSVEVTGAAAGIAFYGASLRYDNKIALRYYFTGDAADCTFTANGKKLTPVEKDGRCYVEIGEILPQDLDESFSVTVTDGTGNGLVITYSPMNYIVRMYHKADTTQETKDLLQALYTYHYAAEILSA